MSEVVTFKRVEFTKLRELVSKINWILKKSINLNEEEVWKFFSWRDGNYLNPYP